MSKFNKEKNVQGKVIILTCLWFASILISGFWLFEGKGLYGPWIQYGIATFLLLIGLYDLLSIEGNWQKFKGFAVAIVGLVYLYPALINVI